MRPDVRPVAQAYAEHLLGGGVTPWGAFLAASPAASTSSTSWTGDPPGAAQAELLRRLNRRAGSAGGTDSELAKRVLRRAAPGRGRVDLLLTDPPERVALAELLRVGAGVLADLVAGLPVPVPRDLPPGAASRESASPTRPGPSYRLEGPPITVAALRRRLVAAGLPPRRGTRLRVRRRRPDVVLVVVLPLRRGLFEVWSRRTQQGATKSWVTVLGEWRATGRLPPGVAYDRLAAGWAGRIGPERVHVVAGKDLDRQVAAVLGAPPAPMGPNLPVSVPAPLPPAYVEVVRRTSEVLTFQVSREEKQQRLDLLVTLLAGAGGRPRGEQGPDRLAPGQRRWLQRTGRRSASRLRAGGYVLHGSLAPLRRVRKPVRQAGARDGAVLAALLESVLRAHVARAGADGERGTGR
jgi:hypothetical protein